MAMTHTSTHVYVSFADPYLRCTQCQGWVRGFHDPDRCGCDTYLVNVPCCCRSGVTSACPSWNPVDGCACLEHLGYVGHEEPPVMQQ
jgi:hypothetical protein